MDTFVPAAIYKSFTLYELLKLLSCSLSPSVYSAGDWQRKLSVRNMWKTASPWRQSDQWAAAEGTLQQRQNGQKAEKERLRQVECLWDWM